MSSASGRSCLSFNRTLFSNSHGAFGPRVGKVVLRRENSETTIEMETPAALTWTSRGIVPHLSRDHIAQADAMDWIHVPFESFLERNPPVPTLQTKKDPSDPKPLHSFLGLSPERHIVSLSLRDPNNVRELPPNGDKSISAWCVRGVRKVPPATFFAHSSACQPDVLVVPADTPYTMPPFSSRRIHKNVERSIAWLTEILKAQSTKSTSPIPLILPLAGLTVPQAHSAFSSMLKENLSGRDLSDLSSLGVKCLDDGVWGYLLELGPLKPSYQPLPIVTPTPTPPVEAIQSTTALKKAPEEDNVVSNVVHLLQTSLKPLSVSKIRVAISTQSPHEILRLVNEVGIDLFDVNDWASACARRGVGFDFVFPAPTKDNTKDEPARIADAPPKGRTDFKLDIGHNFFASVYAHDFGTIADNFRGQNAVENKKLRSLAVCPCITCSPNPTVKGEASCDPPHTRAYIHHLLHTHEMSAYAFLEAHNASVVAAFFSGIRGLLLRSLENGTNAFTQEIANFTSYYALPGALLEEAFHDWDTVERSRGKGSLKRARDSEAVEGMGEEDVQGAMALRGLQALGELVQRADLDAPAVLMLDSAPNVDIDADLA